MAQDYQLYILNNNIKAERIYKKNKNRTKIQR